MSPTDAPEEIAADCQEKALALVAELARRYQITAIHPFMESCRSALERADLNIGVLGRFKAGKSSFVNCLSGRGLLPVGVIPVTAVVTDLSGGEINSAEARFRDGTRLRIPVNEISQYISEAENPDNVKGVVSVSVQVPELTRFKGIRLFDTPGLRQLVRSQHRSLFGVGCRGSRCRGMDQAFAITVGMTAVPITVATRCEYCAWLMTPCCNPNRAEMVPKVSPVDIIRA